MPSVDVTKVRRRYRDDVHRKMDKTGGLERAVQVGNLYKVIATHCETRTFSFPE